MKFTSLAVLSLFIGASAFAQTAPKDSTEKKPAPPNYTIKNPRLLMGADQPKDNSNIVLASQFAGALAIKAEAGQDYLSNIQQLTFGGENTSPSFSPDGSRVIFEARSFNGTTCKQIYSLTLNGTEPARVSTGRGEAQWASFSPKQNRVLFTSTHEMIDGTCPPPTDVELKNPIAINALYDLYVRDSAGTVVAVTNDKKVFDGIASISPDNKKIVFSSTRSGDVDLFLLDLEKNQIRQLTSDEGFEGFARFSPDGKKIVFCAMRAMGDGVKTYRRTLIGGNVNLSTAEIYVMDLDSNTLTQMTANGALNTQPIFAPSGEAIMFASNMHDTDRMDMAIYAQKLTGGAPVQVVNSQASEQYPMFSPDGRKFLFVSDYGAKQKGEKNIFVGDWKH
ncbi:MAG TPA: hypothetical protein VFH43_11150 [Candidatus Kapabacteria bacterium]|nr:hypothetical protein [Candidatus Kapabacteria bacterium]